MLNTINAWQLKAGQQPHEADCIVEDEKGNFVETVAWWSDNPIGDAMAAADAVVSYYHSHGLPCIRVVKHKGQEVYRSMTN